MAGDDPINDITPCKIYTYAEACNYMKEENKKPTDIYKPPTKWVDVNTGKEVIIGYSGF